MRGPWNSLLGKSGTNEIFLTWEWMYSWWRCYKTENKRLFIIAGSDADGNLAGIAPFYITKERGRDFSSGRVVRFCSTVDTYPDHLDIIAEKEYESSFLDGMFKYLADIREDWDILKFDGIKENSAIYQYLAEKHRQIEDNYIIECATGTLCPYVSLEGSYQDFMKTFTSKDRYNILSRRKKLLENGSAFFKEAYEEEKDKYLSDLFSVHAHRAISKGIKSSFKKENVYNFHKNFMDLAFEGNKIMLISLVADSGPLAYWYCLRHGNKYYTYQTGLSDEGRKKSAGFVLLSMAIERAFGEGCGEFDFLRGGEEYKSFWTNKYRRNYNYIIRKKNTAAWLSSKGGIWFKKFKQAIKPIIYPGSGPKQ